MSRLKATMVIPTYWGRDSKTGIREGDLTYDHPTHIDEDGTLLRCLESISKLKDKDFTLVILACATAPDIAQTVDTKVRKIISQADMEVETLLFSSIGLHEMNRQIKAVTGSDYSDLLTLKGYSPIRNMCLFAGHVLESDITIFIDDDEVFEDPNFINKAREHIGKVADKESVFAVAGYYLQADGDYLLSPKHEPWMKAWDNAAMMNKGFEQIIGTDPRLKSTPFVFGGNMVIHRTLGERIPFDPNVPRGEDIDYLMNARMFGYTFFLDNELSIKHLPPSNKNPRWLQIRKDMKRFAFERAKINSQKDVPGMIRITAEDFDPYPGAFLKTDLEKKAHEANQMLVRQYRLEGNEKDEKEALQNIKLAATRLVPEGNPFESLCALQGRWQEMMKTTAEQPLRRKLKQLLRKN